MLLRAGILKAGRVGGVTKVVDSAADAQKVVGATTKAGRALDTTGDIARTANVSTDAGKAADAVVDATRGATTPKPTVAAKAPDAAKAAAPSASVEGTRAARAADAASDVGRTADTTTSAAKAVDETADAARAASAARKGAPRQVTGDLDELYRHAAAAQDDLAAATRSIAEATGGKPVIPGLKGRERALEKIATDYGGDASKITDLARSSIVYDRADDLYRALDKLQEQYKVLRVKDRLKAPLEDGYRDVLVNVEMPNGHIAEMQFHLDEIMRVKNGPGHALYEEIRSTRAAAFRENRPHTAAELQKIEAAQEKSRKLYDDAAARAWAPVERGTSTAEAGGRTSGGQEVSSIGQRGGTSGDDGVNLLESKQVQPRPDGVEFRGFRGGGGRPADRAYASQVSGGAEKAIYVNGIEFDSVRGGVLIDAKRASARGSFYDISGTDRFTQRVKIPAIVDQAKRQLAAVRGQKFKGIEWQVSDLQVARQLQALLLRQGLRIKVVHTPKKG
jgi:hypothetical protein